MSSSVIIGKKDSHQKIATRERMETGRKKKKSKKDGTDSCGKMERHLARRKDGRVSEESVKSEVSTRKSGR